MEDQQSGALSAINRGKQEWWRGAVLYQIYPRSFLDTNGDGVGDLKGIIQKLDYVASLGVDGIWLSPFFTSPMNDFGYDVADFCNVDPVFGTLDDFKALLEKAHGLGLKVIIDQVYAHTSDQHGWFVESRQSDGNTKSDWYVWANAKKDGSPPNNWQSVFGGGAWTWDARRKQYYFHNFLASQPALNLHNHNVQNALLEVAQFWLSLGVDGFRLDAINFCMHDPQLRDNPPAPDDGRVKNRSFDFQEHLYNQSHADIPIFLERLRALTDEFDEIFTVAEVVGANPLPEMKSFTRGDKRLNTAYNFDFLYADQITPDLVENSLSNWLSGENDGWPAWAFSNHDTPRAISRWGSAQTNESDAKLFLLLLLALRGNVFVYQGEELGLPQAEISFDQLKDPEAIANWPQTLGRDGARTPMPWQMSGENAGFSGAQPWLPIPAEHASRSVDYQERQENSVLQFTRALIQFRKNSKALRFGDITFMENSPEGLIAFTRSARTEKATCVFNVSETEISWIAPKTSVTEIKFHAGFSTPPNRHPETLPPMSGYIAI